MYSRIKSSSLTLNSKVMSPSCGGSVLTVVAMMFVVRSPSRLIPYTYTTYSVSGVSCAMRIDYSEPVPTMPERKSARERSLISARYSKYSRSAWKMSFSLPL